MEYRPFGRSEIRVSALGYGAGQLGDPALSNEHIRALFARLQDLGINLIDTARGYGSSEARIGEWLPGKREDWVLSTKIGYGIEGIPDWTRNCILAGVDQALKQLRTDYLDIVHLHSCPEGTLEQGEVIEALLDTVAAGKVRIAAYSGENEALGWAIRSGEFGSIQSSVNLCDQYSLNRLIPAARARGLGVIAKRPLANAFWRFASQPHGDYSETYWLRWREMALETGIPVEELAVRFAVHAPGVDSCIIGSRRPEHLADNVELAAKGPLPDEIQSLLTERFAAVGKDWRSEI